MADPVKTNTPSADGAQAAANPIDQYPTTVSCYLAAQGVDPQSLRDPEPFYNIHGEVNPNIKIYSAVRDDSDPALKGKPVKIEIGLDDWTPAYGENSQFKTVDVAVIDPDKSSPPTPENPHPIPSLKTQISATGKNHISYQATDAANNFQTIFEDGVLNSITYEQNFESVPAENISPNLTKMRENSKACFRG